MIYAREECGFRIELDDERGIYTVYDGEGAVVKETKSKVALEKFIDDPDASAKKKAKKTVRIPVFWLEGWGESKIEKGSATSLAAETKYRSCAECWVVDVKGERSKKEAEHCYLDTVENIALLSKIREIEEKRKELYSQIGELRSSMKTVTRDMFASNDE